MVASNPNPDMNEQLGNGLPQGVNGLGQEVQPPHELYKEIANQMLTLGQMDIKGEIKNDIAQDGYLSPWLNTGFYNGSRMGGNFEKYLVDKDGYAVKHFTCTILNYDIEKTLKESLIEAGTPAAMGEGRTMEVFNEEYALICGEIEKLIAGAKSPLNPAFADNLQPTA
jgi:hypothetical protein